MSDLLIHGGRRLSGRITVEGNKNAALPLLAACLLTTETCEIRNVPRIRDVAVMIELLRSLGAEVEGQGTPTLRVTCREHRVVRARSAARRPAARIGAAAGRAARRGPAARCSRRPAATFRRGGRSRRICARSRAMGARIVETAGRQSARGARRPDRHVDVSARGVGHRHGDRAAGRGAGDGRRPRFATPPASRTSPSCASSCRRWARDVEGIGTSTIRIEPPARLHGATHTLRGDYIEAASWGVVGAITGGEVEITGAMARGPRADRPRSRRDGPGARARGRPLRRPSVDARRRRGASRPDCGPASRATSSAS